MKEWSNKPSALVQTNSSPVKTVSSSSLIKTSSPLVQTSGSLVKTSSSATTLTSGTSSITLSSSSLGGTGTTLTRRAAIGAAVAGPLTVGVVAGGMSMVFFGVANMIRYGKNEKTGAQAAKDTVKGAAGVGVSAGLGVAAAHAVAGTALALGTSVIVPLAAGVGAAYAGMKIWNSIFFKNNATSKSKKSA